MLEFTVKIAGYVLAVKALYPKTKEVFRDYLTDEQPLIIIESSEETIVKERKLLQKNDVENRLDIDSFSDAEIESNFLYREVTEQLSKHGVVLIHGSAVAVDGECFIFVAPSGTGKSTHTRLWMEKFGNRAMMINDDKPLLKCSDNGITVFGSPWNGKCRLGTNTSAPLKAICFLERGKENKIEQFNTTKSFVSLLKSVYHSKTANRESCILQSLQCIHQKTAFYRLKCNMEPSAATVAYNGMKNKAE